MATPRARITADTPPAEIAAVLRRVANHLELSPAVTPEGPAALLGVLEGIADVIAAGAPNGPLRARRQAIYEALLSAGVKREEIARAAGVSVPAIGFSIGSAARKAATVPATQGKRKPRPR